MSHELIHYCLLIFFIICTTLIYYKMLVADDMKIKKELKKNILDGKVKYVWVGGLMAKVESICSPFVISVCLIGEDGDTPPFYCKISDIKFKVLDADLKACNIINEDNTETLQIEEVKKLPKS